MSAMLLTPDTEDLCEVLDVYQMITIAEEVLEYVTLHTGLLRDHLLSHVGVTMYGEFTFKISCRDLAPLSPVISASVNLPVRLANNPEIVTRVADGMVDELLASAGYSTEDDPTEE